jgi:hypothetical protein
VAVKNFNGGGRPSQFAFFYFHYISDNEMEEVCGRNEGARDKIRAQHIGQES